MSLAVLLACAAILACGTSSLRGGPPCRDDDGDGFRSLTCGGDDCDDTRADVHPGASEICLDGLDNDCDTVVDGPGIVGPRLVIFEHDSTGWGTAWRDPSVSLAWTGSEFAAAWQRPDPPDCTHLDEECTFELYVTRITPEGEEVGEEEVYGYAGSPDLVVPYSPHLTWTGSELLATWTMDSWSAHGGPHVSRFYAASMAPSVELLDVDYVEIPGDGIQSTEVAWTGSTLGIVHDLGYFAILGSDGTTVLDFTVLGTGESDVAWTGSEFAVAWSDLLVSIHLDLHLSRLDPGGAVLEDVLWREGASGLHQKVLASWTGSELGFVWTESSRDDGTWSMLFARLSPLGDAVSDHVPLLHVDYERSLVQVHDLAWTGSRFSLLYSTLEEEGGDFLYRYSVSRFDAAGRGFGPGAHILDVDMEIASPRPYFSDLAWTGSELGLAWTMPRPEGGRGHVTAFNRIGFCE